MKFLVKIFLVFILICSLLATTVSAVSNADAMRVYRKVYQDPTFLPQLYTAVPLYQDLFITNDSVNAVFKESIKKVLTLAEEEKDTGKLTEVNLKDRLKSITVKAALSMDPAYIALFTDAFSEQTVLALFDGEIPEEFEPLYNAIASEAYVVLGFGQRKVLNHIFDDLGNHQWAEKAIAYLFDKDILNGVSDFSFMPSANVTREQFAKMMCVAFSVEMGTQKPTFSDVLENDWFYPYVTAMASQKLILGVGDGRFGSGQNITRQDMAVLMFRIGENLGVMKQGNAQTSGFLDEHSIAAYAKNAVIALKELGIINGNEQNCFNPTMPATRAEAAQMLYNCYQYVNR